MFSSKRFCYHIIYQNTQTDKAMQIFRKERGLSSNLTDRLTFQF